MNGKAGMVGVYLLSLLAILLWGMSYLWSDSLLALGIPVEYIVFARISIAGVVLLVFNLATGQSIRMQKKHVLKFILIAFFEPFIYFVCETYGIRFTESPTISSLLIAAAPIFSVIAGMAIFNEKFSLFNMFGILVCLGGIVMVTLCSESMGEHFVLGIVLLVVAVLAEVGHASLTKYLTDSYSPSVIVMYQFLIGSVFLFPLFAGPGLKNFDAELYLSWEDAVARANERYAVVLDRYRSGKYPKHERFSDEFFNTQGDLMEAMSRVAEMRGETGRLRRELREGFDEAREALREKLEKEW